MEKFQQIRNTLILFLLGIIWLLKPIPFQAIVQNQPVSQEVLDLRGGGKDSTESSGFIPPNLQSPKRSTNSGGKDPQTRVQKDPPNHNSRDKMRYRPGAPSAPSGGLGAGNVDDLLANPDPDNMISDPEFWNAMEESEDESQPAEAPKNSPPTSKLTKKEIQKNDQSTKQIDPIKFVDWEGDDRVLRSQELKKSVYSHGYEAGVVSPEDLVPCPVQPDPTKYQREDCARITDKGIKKFAAKIIGLATSRKPGMVKFEIPMPYFDTQSAIGHMNIVTGECAFFHQDGKYWTYKKYEREEVLKLIGQSGSIPFKLASPDSSPKSEL